MNALSISFDSVGYGTTLARTFNWVSTTNIIDVGVYNYSIFRLANFGIKDRGY